MAFAPFGLPRSEMNGVLLNFIMCQCIILPPDLVYLELDNSIMHTHFRFGPTMYSRVLNDGLFVSGQLKEHILARSFIRMVVRSVLL